MHTPRTPGLLAAAIIVLAVNASPFAANAQKSPAVADNAATQNESDTLIDRVFAAYQDRFRHWVGEAPNETVHAMVRAELPGILKIDAATVNAVLSEEAQRLTKLDAPIERKLAALFILGQYEVVIETGEKHMANRLLIPEDGDCSSLHEFVFGISKKLFSDKRA